MKTVIILYEHIAREYEVCSRLRNIMQDIGTVDVYVFSLHFQMDQVYKLAMRHIIDVIAVPYAYKEKSLAGLLLLVKRKRVKLILNLRHEQIGAQYNEHRLYPYDSFIKDKVYHIAWTDYYKEKLVLKGVPADHVLVTQNPRTDLIYESDEHYLSREAFAKKYDLDPQKKWLLVCESGETYSPNQITRMLSLGYLEVDLLEYNRIIERDKASTETQLNALDESFLNKYEVIYRPHPGTKCSLLLDKHIRIINQESIYCWINYIDAVISRMSTVLFEAQANGVPAFWFCPNDIGKRYITYGIDKLPMLRNISQLDHVIVSSVPNDIYINYIGIINGKAVQSLALAIRSLLSSNIDLYSDYHLKTEIPYLRSAVRHLLSNKYSHFAFCSNIAALRRYSRSLVTFENDIPPEWK